MSGESTWVDEVRERIDIEEIVSEHTDLRRKGRDLRGPCPIHGGNNPNNFSVRPDLGRWDCYSDCADGGDAFKFLMQLTGKGFLEVAKDLARRYGVEIERAENATPLSDEEKARWAASLSGRDERTQSAWSAVGVAPETTQYLKLGLSQDGSGSLTIPIWGSDEDRAPGGWLAYAPAPDGSVVPSGWLPGAREGIDGSLYLPSGLLGAAKESIPWFVPDPILAVRLREKGVRAVFSVARQPSSVGDWVSDPSLARLASRWGNQPWSRVLLLVPAATDAQKRALFASELPWLRLGVQPIWCDLSEAFPSEEEPFGWEWVSKTADVEGLSSLALDPARWHDLFGLRARMVRRQVATGRMSPHQALEKLLPSLRAVESTSPVLFEIYLASAARMLQMTPTQVRGRVRGVPLSVEGEAF